MRKTVRVRDDIQAVSVEVPGVPGARVTLKAGDAYDSKDDLVRHYPWAFTADNVEQTTAAPGERRTARQS